MLKVVKDSTLSAIGDALREKTVGTDTYLPSEMAPSIVNYTIGCDQIARRIPAYAHGIADAIVPSAFVGLSDMITGVDFPNCESVGSYAFSNCTLMSEVSLPSCRAIDEGAFISCNAISTLSLPMCEVISNKAFISCTSLTNISAPNLTVLGTNTDIGYNGPFESCIRLTSAYVPNLTNILDRAFCNCFSLSDLSISKCTLLGAYALTATAIASVDVPECVSIGVYCFANCSSLLYAHASSCISINNYAFRDCINLLDTSFNTCMSIGTYAFWNCPRISSASFPECSYVGSSAFRIAENVTQFFSSLKYAYFPKCTFLGQCAFVCQTGLSYAHFPMLSSVQLATFWGCSGLSDVTFQNCWSIVGHGNYGAFERAGMSVVSLPTCRYIGDRAFMSCYSLMSLYLTGGSYVSLPSQRALWSTPLSLSTYTGGFGSIYVPASMLTGYQSMANWSVYSSRFVGMTLSVGDAVSAFSSYDLIGPVGVSMGYQNVEEGKLGLNTFSGGHEGFNIELSNLEMGKDYTLEFDLRFIDAQFFSTSQYCVGFMVTADKRTNYTEYTTWPNNITRDNNEHHYAYTFMASSDKMYLSFALDGLSDRNQSMTITNVVVHESEWVV